MTSEIAVVSAHLPASYCNMLVTINDALPRINRASQHFGKAHSQFMVVTLDVTHLTTVRAIKHTLAEIERTRQALNEAQIAQRRRDIDVRECRARLLIETDEFARERLNVDILEAEAHGAATSLSVKGAIRKLSHLVMQYDALMAKLGKEELTEADYEADEARYHIMTALKQALCAARARGGIIDEGNHIYLFDMGLPAAEVQAQVRAYLVEENRLLNEGKAPTHAMTMAWLEACADRWQHCARDNAARRGMPLCDPASLHVSED